MRQKDAAVGVQNIGNTCYSSSLFQIYYSLPDFVMKILSFEASDFLRENHNAASEADKQKIESGY